MEDGRSSSERCAPCGDSSRMAMTRSSSAANENIRLHTRIVDPSAYFASVLPFIDPRDWYARSMNVEDSYEGALRRMQRLEMAGFSMEQPSAAAADEPAADGSADRMRELEELATLACDDNERLKRELGVALQQLEGVRAQADGARAEMARAVRRTDRDRSDPSATTPG